MCGGTEENHNFCLTRAWIVYNPTTCINCFNSDTVNGYCGGNNSAYNNLCNTNGYFYSSTEKECFYCGNAIGTDCGNASIRSVCTANKWIYDTLSNCVSCLIPNNPKCCDISCKTCNGPLTNNCTSCSGA